MNIIKKMILFIKNIFVKDKTIETIEKPTYTVKQENADDFAFLNFSLFYDIYTIKNT